MAVFCLYLTFEITLSLRVSLNTDEFSPVSFFLKASKKETSREEKRKEKKAPE